MTRVRQVSGQFKPGHSVEMDIQNETSGSVGDRCKDREERLRSCECFIAVSRFVQECCKTLPHARVVIDDEYHLFTTIQIVVPPPMFGLAEDGRSSRGAASDDAIVF